MSGLIPVTLVTGFLGSGKTTLIAQALRDPAFDRTLVVVNEFGEVGIDHDLLEASSDDTVLLANGCLCCTIRGNLVDTLDDVRRQQAEGRLRAFDRVVIETSGVADPAPLTAFLLGEPAFTDHYRLAAIITVCDAAAGVDTLAAHPEAESQARLADLLVVTKRDIAAPERAAAFEAHLRALNPLAPIRHAVEGDLAAAELLCDYAHPPLPEPAHGHRHDHDDASPDATASGHTARFASAVLTPARPLEASEIEAALAALGAATPPPLRVKGILRVAGESEPRVIQGAGAVLRADNAPVENDAGNRLVIISTGPVSPALIAALSACGLRPIGESTA